MGEHKNEAKTVENEDDFDEFLKKIELMPDIDVLERSPNGFPDYKETYAKKVLEKKSAISREKGIFDLAASSSMPLQRNDPKFWRIEFARALYHTNLNTSTLAVNRLGSGLTSMADRYFNMPLFSLSKIAYQLYDIFKQGRYGWQTVIDLASQAISGIPLIATHTDLIPAFIRLYTSYLPTYIREILLLISNSLQTVIGYLPNIPPEYYAIVFLITVAMNFLLLDKYISLPQTDIGKKLTKLPYFVDVYEKVKSYTGMLVSLLPKSTADFSDSVLFMLYESVTPEMRNKVDIEQRDGVTVWNLRQLVDIKKNSTVGQSLLSNGQPQSEHVITKSFSHKETSQGNAFDFNHPIRSPIKKDDGSVNPPDDTNSDRILAHTPHDIQIAPVMNKLLREGRPFKGVSIRALPQGNDFVVEYKSWLSDVSGKKITESQLWYETLTTSQINELGKSLSNPDGHLEKYLPKEHATQGIKKAQEFMDNSENLTNQPTEIMSSLYNSALSAAINLDNKLSLIVQRLTLYNPTDARPQGQSPVAQASESVRGDISRPIEYEPEKIDIELNGNTETYYLLESTGAFKNFIKTEGDDIYQWTFYPSPLSKDTWYIYLYNTQKNKYTPDALRVSKSSNNRYWEDKSGNVQQRSLADRVRDHREKVNLEGHAYDLDPTISDVIKITKIGPEKEYIIVENSSPELIYFNTKESYFIDMTGFTNTVILEMNDAYFGTHSKIHSHAHAEDVLLHAENRMVRFALHAGVENSKVIDMAEVATKSTTEKILPLTRYYMLYIDFLHYFDYSYKLFKQENLLSENFPFTLNYKRTLYYWLAISNKLYTQIQSMNEILNNHPVIKHGNIEVPSLSFYNSFMDNELKRWKDGLSPEMEAYNALIRDIGNILSENNQQYGTNITVTESMTSEEILSTGIQRLRIFAQHAGVSTEGIIDIKEISEKTAGPSLLSNYGSFKYAAMIIRDMDYHLKKSLSSFKQEHNLPNNFLNDERYFSAALYWKEISRKLLSQSSESIKNLATNPVLKIAKLSLPNMEKYESAFGETGQYGNILKAVISAPSDKFLNALDASSDGKDISFDEYFSDQIKAVNLKNDDDRKTRLKKLNSFLMLDSVRNVAQKIAKEIAFWIKIEDNKAASFPLTSLIILRWYVQDKLPDNENHFLDIWLNHLTRPYNSPAANDVVSEVGTPESMTIADTHTFRTLFKIAYNAYIHGSYFKNKDKFSSYTEDSLNDPWKSNISDNQLKAIIPSDNDDPHILSQLMLEPLCALLQNNAKSLDQANIMISAWLTKKSTLENFSKIFKHTISNGESAWYLLRRIVSFDHENKAFPMQPDEPGLFSIDINLEQLSIPALTNIYKYPYSDRMKNLIALVVLTKEFYNPHINSDISLSLSASKEKSPTIIEETFLKHPELSDEVEEANLKSLRDEKIKTAPGKSLASWLLDLSGLSESEMVTFPDNWKNIKSLYQIMQASPEFRSTAGTLKFLPNNIKNEDIIDYSQKKPENDKISYWMTNQGLTSGQHAWLLLDTVLNSVWSQIKTHWSFDDKYSYSSALNFKNEALSSLESTLISVKLVDNKSHAEIISQLLLQRHRPELFLSDIDRFKEDYSLSIAGMTLRYTAKILEEISPRSTLGMSTQDIFAKYYLLDKIHHINPDKIGSLLSHSQETVVSAPGEAQSSEASQSKNLQLLSGFIFRIENENLAKRWKENNATDFFESVSKAENLFATQFKAFQDDNENLPDIYKIAKTLIPNAEDTVTAERTANNYLATGHRSTPITYELQLKRYDAILSGTRILDKSSLESQNKIKNDVITSFRSQSNDFIKKHHPFMNSQVKLLVNDFPVETLELIKNRRWRLYRPRQRDAVLLANGIYAILEIEQTNKDNIFYNIIKEDTGALKFVRGASKDNVDIAYLSARYRKSISAIALLSPWTAWSEVRKITYQTESANRDKLGDLDLNKMSQWVNLIPSVVGLSPDEWVEAKHHAPLSAFNPASSSYQLAEQITPAVWDIPLNQEVDYQIHNSGKIPELRSSEASRPTSWTDWLPFYSYFKTHPDDRTIWDELGLILDSTIFIPFVKAAAVSAKFAAKAIQHSVYRGLAHFLKSGGFSAGRGMLTLYGKGSANQHLKNIMSQAVKSVGHAASDSALQQGMKLAAKTMGYGIADTALNTAPVPLPSAKTFKSLGDKLFNALRKDTDAMKLIGKIDDSSSLFGGKNSIPSNQATKAVIELADAAEHSALAKKSPLSEMKLENIDICNSRGRRQTGCIRFTTKIEDYAPGSMRARNQALYNEVLIPDEQAAGRLMVHDWRVYRLVDDVNAPGFSRAEYAPNVSAGDIVTARGSVEGSLKVDHAFGKLSGATDDFLDSYTIPVHIKSITDKVNDERILRGSIGDLGGDQRIVIIEPMPGLFYKASFIHYGSPYYRKSPATGDLAIQSLENQQLTFTRMDVHTYHPAQFSTIDSAWAKYHVNLFNNLSKNKKPPSSRELLLLMADTDVKRNLNDHGISNELINSIVRQYPYNYNYHLNKLLDDTIKQKLPKPRPAINVSMPMNKLPPLPTSITTVSKKNEWLGKKSYDLVINHFESSGIKNANQRLTTGEDFLRQSAAAPLVSYLYDYSKYNDGNMGYFDTILRLGAGNCDQMAAVSAKLINDAGGVAQTWNMPGAHTFTLVGDINFGGLNQKTVSVRRPDGSVFPTEQYSHPDFSADIWKDNYIVDPWIGWHGPAQNYDQAFERIMQEWHDAGRYISFKPDNSNYGFYSPIHPDWLSRTRAPRQPGYTPTQDVWGRNPVAERLASHGSNPAVIDVPTAQKGDTVIDTPED